MVVVRLVVLTCVLGDDKIKVVNFFEEKKCTPQKILAAPMTNVLHRSNHSKIVHCTHYCNIRKIKCKKLLFYNNVQDPVFCHDRGNAYECRTGAIKTANVNFVYFDPVY